MALSKTRNHSAHTMIPVDLIWHYSANISPPLLLTQHKENVNHKGSHDVRIIAGQTGIQCEVSLRYNALQTLIHGPYTTNFAATLSPIPF